MEEKGGHFNIKVTNKYGGYIGVGNSSFYNYIHS